MNALISVFKKEGVLELAKYLQEKGFHILSSGGTARYLMESGIAVRSVDSVTGFPEILDGRVKTLHPNIHGGILARRDDEAHMETLAMQQIEPIDVVCVNLYPFEEKLKEGLSFDDMIEFIDIGGPSMLRSAAKNFKDVYVLSDPDQYAEFMKTYAKGEDGAAYRRRLALAVFEKTAGYDGAIAQWLQSVETADPAAGAGSGISTAPGSAPVFPDEMTLKLRKVRDLRYGENPHQKGSFYALEGTGGFMTSFVQHHGKELGYINYKDLEAAWRIVSDFEEPCCAAVKHNTPCGVALGQDAADAYSRAHACDPLSIFGGIVAVNREVDGACAGKMLETMLHIVCAPSYTARALELLRTKKNLIIIEMKEPAGTATALISSDGGILIQEEDGELYRELTTVTQRVPDESELAELLFAMKVVKFTKSNAIVVSKDRAAVGIGGGFVNRIDAARYALDHAGSAVCLASDAFFPFPDVVEAAHQAGIRAIIQPGGSQKDEASIRRCDELGIAMVFTGMRHFRH